MEAPKVTISARVRSDVAAIVERISNALDRGLNTSRSEIYEALIIQGIASLLEYKQATSVEPTRAIGEIHAELGTRSEFDKEFPGFTELISQKFQYPNPQLPTAPPEGMHEYLGQLISKLKAPKYRTEQKLRSLFDGEGELLELLKNPKVLEHLQQIRNDGLQKQHLLPPAKINSSYFPLLSPSLERKISKHRSMKKDKK